MENKVIVITGASDGIGAEAARELKTMGAEVVIVGRSPEKTKKVAQELRSKYYVADFAKLCEVRELGAALRSDVPKIDILANNAGGIFGNRKLTVDGHEKTMQVNHLAHFLLTNLLLEPLIASKGVVINTSSLASKFYSDFDIDDLELTNHYSETKAYGNSKLENILFTRELHRRYHKDGLYAVAFHPGNVATNFASETGHFMKYLYHSWIAQLVFISSKKGADTLVWLASTRPDIDWKSGEYYQNRKLSNATDKKKAYDERLAIALWEKSAKMVGI